jgi:hypothetical protein
MDVNIYLLYGVPVVGLVMALVRLAREVGLPTRFAPAAALILGVLGGVAIAYQNGVGYVEGAVIGLVIGAAASGFYDNAKFVGEASDSPEITD